jgi:hypothetical protein
MADEDTTPHPSGELSELLQHNFGAQVLRAAMQTLAGELPVGGGALAAAAGAWSERDQGKVNNLLVVWLKQLEADLAAMGTTLADVLIRVDLNDEDVRKRLESPEYQALVSKVFRNWSATESVKKREMLRNLLANAAGKNITGDDVISIFISWINDYTDTHFGVVSAVYKTPGITKYAMWEAIGGQQVADNSPEADLFKYITFQLTTGYVMRQDRQTTAGGQFVRQTTRRPADKSGVMKTPFDNKDPYVLTALGEQFVHYALNEVVPKIGSGKVEQ